MNTGQKDATLDDSTGDFLGIYNYGGDKLPVLHNFPGDDEVIQCFTNGFLYESKGINLESSLRKVKPESGEVVQKFDWPEAYFGEGIIKWHDKVYPRPRYAPKPFLRWSAAPAVADLEIRSSESVCLAWSGERPAPPPAVCRSQCTASANYDHELRSYGEGL